MGLIRVLLAIAVVIAHADTFFGIRMTGGLIAVQSFYIISGFYMSLILNEKYSKTSDYRLFMSNRLLRLFPIYLAVLSATIVLCGIIGYFSNDYLALQVWIDNYSTLAPSSILLAIFANLFLYAQDLMLFLGINSEGSMHFASRFADAEIPMFKFLLIPQAWTIGLELTFYLIAPFLVRKSTMFLIGLVVFSFALRFWSYSYFEINYDPWTYRFFPFELAFFMLGSLAYKGYLRIKNFKIDNRLNFILLGILVIYVLFYNLIPFRMELKQWAFYFLVFLSVPFLFIYTKSMKFDNKIGELSYPVYISHILIILLINYFMPELKYLGEVAVIVSVVFSLGLIYLISDPVEKLRKSRYLKSKNKSFIGQT